MYKYKDTYIKKGYVTVYVLLVCSLCMILVSYSFYLEVKKIRNLKSYTSLIINTKKLDEYKEYLFTYLHKEVISSLSSLTYDNVKQCLTANNFKFKFDNGKACIKYDYIKNKINFETYYDADYYRRDIYDYKVVSNKLKYIYLNTIYIEGRIE
jgi:hypothetical protein